MAVSVVVAVGDIGDALVEALAARARSLSVGPGLGNVDMGPLISKEHRDRVRRYVDIGVSEGALPVVDGRTVTVPGFDRGFFIGPSLFDRVTPEMTIYKDEIFGPVLSVVRVSSLDEAIRIVNANPYGNGTSIFTNSGPAARRFEHEVEVGMVGVNVAIPVPMAFFSFGGWKQSLFGDLHVHGIEGVYFYTRTKAITTRWQSADTLSLSMPTL
jgi:malonate-semialdehyde dehydrogenase (acetylating)/methylmalonate-semialdehyde dehydrogenase